MEEESWRMYPGGIMEEVLWRRHQEEEQWHPGTQEAPRRHPGSTQEAPRWTHEAPRRHQVPRRHQEAKDILETECVFSYAPARKSDASDHFHVHGSDVTITVYRACAQNLVSAWPQKAELGIPNTEDTPPEPLQQRLFGNYTYTSI